MNPGTRIITDSIIRDFNRKNHDGRNAYQPAGVPTDFDKAERYFTLWGKAEPSGPLADSAEIPFGKGVGYPGSGLRHGRSGMYAPGF